ncbi:hypothetical protein QAD02_006424 [Eretmocerus hayati]|uniref:Uncharacterized protein n=1 Tax=Eretmocerus hayati TaxID=131215 RepID=A0ACC2N168_9HYME|nr:hypothetical protein QAD02_006424 [Eretmocerus hayati]
MVDNEDAAVAVADPIYNNLKESMNEGIKRNDLVTVCGIVESGFKYRFEEPVNIRRIESHEGGCECQNHKVQPGPYPAYLNSIALGNIEMINLVLKAKPDLDCMNSYGYGPLHLASSIKDHDTRWSMVKMLMNAGVTVVDDGLPSTCVHQAVAVDDFELVKYFLQAGAQLNCLDLSDRSVLHIAYMYISGRKRKSTFLHFVAKDDWCWWEMVKLVLDLGAQLNIMDVDNISPLASAASGGNIEVVKNMIDAGADVNITKQCTGSPLQFAVSGCSKDIVELLLEQGADIKVEDEDGKNLLFYATQINNSLA